MNKIHWLSGIVLLTAIIVACNNPFWPKLNIEEFPQLPTVVIYPDITDAPDGVYYFVNTPAADVQDLYVTASVIGGGVLTYQWYSYPEGNPGAAAAIAYATGTEFKPPVNEIGETYYYVVVTNTLNGNAAFRASSHILVKVVDEDTIPPEWLYQVNLTINAPMKGEKPDTNLVINDPVNIKANSIVWRTLDGTVIEEDEEFAPGTVYTVTITLEALNNHIFAPVHYLTVPTINAVVIPVENLSESPDQLTLTLSLRFTATLERAVDDIEIVTQPWLDYIHGEPLNLEGLVVKLIYDDGSDDEIAYLDFGTLFTTNLTHGLILDHGTHDGQKISVTFNARITKETDALIVAPITIPNVDLFVTAPVTGAVPSSAATGEGNFTIKSLTWDPLHNPFLGGEQYKASITIEAEENYKFTVVNMPAYINGQGAVTESNNGDTAVIVYTFTTEVRAPNGLSVQTQPRLVYDHNDRLDLSNLKVRISYNDSTYKDVEFENFETESITTDYQNDITLDRTTHNNKPVKVTFSTFEASTDNLTVNAAPVSSAIITVIPPEATAVPSTSAVYTGPFEATSVIWSPAQNPFQAGGTYTVTITLAANNNYTFTSGFTAQINGAAATISENSGNTVKAFFQFPTLSAAIATGITIIGQPDKLDYIHGEPLDLTGLKVRVSFNDHTSQDIAFADFSGVITTNPANGTSLTHTGNDDKPIVVTRGSFNANTNNLTVDKRALLIESATASKVYNNTEAPDTVHVVLTGVASIDSAASVSADVITAVYTGVIAGTNTINVTGVTLTSNNPGAADAAWRNYTVTPRNGISVSAIAARPVTITPVSGQSKVFGADDPVLTFTSSETIIGGNTQNGALSRSPGENFGSYAINLGTLSWGDNYNLSLSTPAVNFTITRAAGAAVNPFTVSQTASSPFNNIRTTEVTQASNTEQTIEFAYNDTGVTPAAADWHDIASNHIISIDNLTYGKTYHVFARAKESANYTAGEIVKREITVTKHAGAAVSTFTASQITSSPNNTYNIITINAAALTGNLDQIIEYAYTTGAVPADGDWEDITLPLPVIIDKLVYGTTYHVFARAKESTNYLPGTAVSRVITVNKHEGAEVSTFTASQQVSPYNSIIITAAALTGTGSTEQTIEYACTTEETPAAGDWKNITFPLPTISGLADGTYNVFARAKESDNYLAGEIVSVVIPVNKHAGAAINVFNLSASHNTIRVDSATLSNNAAQQTMIEYIRSDSAEVPETGWLDLGNAPLTNHFVYGLAGLASGTEYWIHIRAKASDDYAAGAVTTKSIWTQTELTSIIITFNPLLNPAAALQLPINKIEIERGSASKTELIMPSAGFTEIQWYLNGEAVSSNTGSIWQYDLIGSNFDKFYPAINSVYVEVKNAAGFTYSLTIPFELVNPINP